MLILGIETSGLKCSVAFVRGQKTLAEYSIEAANLHAEILGSLVNDGFDRLGIAASAIDLVAVASGPGSFTGLRIGMAYAKGYAYALEKPVISISNFEILAERAVPGLWPVDVLIDARLNRFYHARFDQGGMLSGSAGLTDPDGLRSKLRDAVQIIVQKNTDTAFVKQAAAGSPIMIEAEYYAAVLCRLAGGRFGRGERQDLTEMEPMYLQKFAGAQ